MRARLLIVTVIVVGVVADQLSKTWAVGALADGRTVAILPTVEFDLSYNSGFSFSTGTGHGQLIGAVVLFVSAYLARVTFLQTSVERGILLAVILAGALGNLSDRIFRANDGPLSGEIVDFIDVSWFAVFNVADVWVVGGVVLFVVVEVLSSDVDRPTSDRDVAAATNR